MQVMGPRPVVKTSCLFSLRYIWRCCSHEKKVTSPLSFCTQRERTQRYIWRCCSYEKKATNPLSFCTQRERVRVRVLCFQNHPHYASLAFARTTEKNSPRLVQSTYPIHRFLFLSLAILPIVKMNVRVHHNLNRNKMCWTNEMSY